MQGVQKASFVPERLLHHLHESLTRPIVVIHGEQGSGQRTLLMAYAARYARRSVDIAIDLGQFPRFEEIRDLIDRHRAEVARPIFLANELPQYIVHHILAAVPLGEDVQVVITTRSQESLPHLIWDLADDVSFIDARALWLTADESAQFLSTRDLKLAAVDMERLFTTTLGWPLALSTALAVANTGSGIGTVQWEQFFSRIRNHMEDRVWPHFTPEEQNLLLHTCYLDHLSPALCDAADGLERAGIRLDTMAGRGLFIWSEDGTYLLHPLLRHYLQWRVEHTHSRAEVRYKKLMAAKAHEAIGEWLSAVPLYITADADEELNRCIGAVYPWPIRTGQLSQLVQHLQPLDRSRRHMLEWVQLYEAEDAEGRGNIDEALQAAERAEALAQQKGARTAWAQSLLLKMRLYLSKGLAPKSIEIGQELLTSLPAEELGLRARALNTLSSSYWQTGEVEHIQEYLSEALQLFRADGNAVGEALVLNNLAVYVHFGRGEYVQAQKLLEESIALSPPESRHTVIALSNLAEVLTLMSRPSEALGILERALAIATKIGFLRGQAEAYSHLGIVYAYLKEGDKSLQSDRHALELARQLGDKELESRALFRLCTTSRRQHRLSDALTWACEAEALLTQVANPYYGVRILAARAMVYAAKGEWPAARRSLLMAHSWVSDTATLPLDYRTDLNLAEAVVAQAGHDVAALDRALERLLAPPRSEGVASELLFEGELGVRLLRQAYTAGIETEFCRGVLDRLESSPDVPPSTAGSEAPIRAVPVLSETSGVNPPRPEHRIHLFGTFSLFVGGEHITQWRRRKSRLLLQVLALRAGEWYSVESLIELIWPGMTLSNGLGNFQVTLHALRQIIEPKGMAPQHLLYDQRRCKLDPGEVYWIDVTAFDYAWRHGWAAEQKKDDSLAEVHYTALIPLYQGDLLQSEPYQDWIEDARQARKGQLLHALTYLARFNLAQNKLSLAAELATQAQTIDPTSEEAAGVAVQALASLGRVNEAVRAFERCRNALRKELGLLPTRLLYDTYEEAVLKKSVHDPLSI